MNAKYYQSKFAAGLLYVGRSGEGEQWLGSRAQWDLSEKLEEEVRLIVKHL